MAQYTKLPEQIEAWKIGSRPVPKWVSDAEQSGAINARQTPDGRKYYAVFSPFGKQVPEEGSYIIKHDDGTYTGANREWFEKTYRISGQ